MEPVENQSGTCKWWCSKLASLPGIRMFNFFYGKLWGEQLHKLRRWSLRKSWKFQCGLPDSKSKTIQYISTDYTINPSKPPLLEFNTSTPYFTSTIHKNSHIEIPSKQDNDLLLQSNASAQASVHPWARCDGTVDTYRNWENTVRCLVQGIHSKIYLERSFN